MRSYKWILVAALLALSAGPPLRADSARIGVYYWGGRFPRSVSEGVNAIAGLGGRVARIVLSPRYFRDYNISTECLPAFSLTGAAQEPDMKRAFDNPAIEVLILTTYDGTVWGDCQKPNYLDAAFFTPAHTAAVVKEYSDFTLYLYRTYQRTHKRFIITDWEADNSVYCGDAYGFATNASIRQACRIQYDNIFPGRAPEDGFKGLRLWWQARAQGIMEGRVRAQAENIGGLRVYMAPELNIVRVLHAAGFPSALYDVIPAVMFDYVSYSSWESIGTADPVTTLWNDLNTIQDVVGSNAIIVGEAGFLRDPGGQNVARTSDIVSAALDWGVAYFIQWQLYDYDSSATFGLFDLDGNRTALADWFQRRFEEETPAISRHSPSRSRQ